MQRASERRVPSRSRSSDANAMRGKREKGEEGTNDRPFGAKTRWRILKNNTRLSPLPRSLSLGPSAILHSRGGLPPSSHPEEDPPLPSPPSVVYSWQRFGGPEKRRDEREGGRARRGSGYSLFTLSDPMRCDPMRANAAAAAIHV